MSETWGILLALWLDYTRWWWKWGALAATLAAYPVAVLDMCFPRLFWRFYPGWLRWLKVSPVEQRAPELEPEQYRPAPGTLVRAKDGSFIRVE